MKNKVLGRISKIYMVLGPATSGLYYKHTTIVNYASSVINKLEALLTNNARVIIYNHHVFIVQATDGSKGPLYIFQTFKK
jgi:hypothetical protein